VTPKAGYYTLTEYDATYTDLGVPGDLRTESLNNNLGQVVAAAGLTQLRAAETEKYPHVTFFFNSGVEEPNPGEDRYLAISPKEVPTYDKKPQMSAPDLTFEVLRRLENYDLVIMNYANPDMVGHTGVVEAGVHACETIDLGVRHDRGEGARTRRQALHHRRPRQLRAECATPTAPRTPRTRPISSTASTSRADAANFTVARRQARRHRPDSARHARRGEPPR